MLRLKIGFVLFIVAGVASVFASRAYRGGAFAEELLAFGCEETPETRSLSTTYEGPSPMRKIETFEVKACGKTWEMVLKDVNASEVEVTSVKELKKP